jgi:hypothetical protein
MNFRKYYTDKDVEIAVKSSKSLAGVMKKIGLVPIGGNYSTVKRKIQKLGLDISHFTGKAWNKDFRMKEWVGYSRVGTLKKHLLREKGNFCNRCNLSKWLDKDIILEIHHIDGDKTNNSLENLELLCPNCHSFTDTWRKLKE